MNLFLFRFCAVALILSGAAIFSRPNPALALGTCTAEARGIQSFSCPGTPTEDVCGAAPNFYCYSEQSEPSCAANKHFDCNSCSCVCNSGFVDCAGVCKPIITCPTGLTPDHCAQTCTTPYVMLKTQTPPGGVFPQSGGIQVTGDIQCTNGDLYLASGRAIRVDGAGVTTLNFGNWGGGTFLMDVGGTLIGDTVQGTNLCIGADCRAAWPGGGGGGTLTSIGAGSGLTAAPVDPITGAGTLNVGAGTGITVGADSVSLDTTYGDGRYLNSGGTETFSGNLMTFNQNTKTIGSAGFGGYDPDAQWNISSPSAYIGTPGVGGTLIKWGEIITNGGISAFRVIGNSELCIGGDCRSSWPVGGGGTVTSISQGTGIVATPNPISGAGTIALDTTYTDSRYINTTGPDGITGQFTTNGDLVVTGGSGFGGHSPDPVYKISAPNAYIGTPGVGGTIISFGNIITDSSVNGNVLNGNAVCIQSDCRSSWPQGTVTSITAGDGLTASPADPITGAGTLQVGAGYGISVTADQVALDTNSVDMRYVNTAGDIMTGELRVPLLGLATAPNVNYLLYSSVPAMTGLANARLERGSNNIELLNNFGFSISATSNRGAYFYNNATLGDVYLASDSGYAIDANAAGTQPNSYAGRFISPDDGSLVYVGGNNFGIIAQGGINFGGRFVHRTSGASVDLAGNTNAVTAVAPPGGYAISAQSGPSNFGGEVRIQPGYGLKLNDFTKTRWPMWEQTQKTGSNSGWNIFPCDSGAIVSFTCYLLASGTYQGCGNFLLPDAFGNASALYAFVPTGGTAYVRLNCQ